MYQHSGGSYESGSGNQYNDHDDSLEQSRSNGAAFQPNAAFADFMRNNDPNSNNISSSSRTPASPAPRPNPNMAGLSNSQRQGQGGRRLMAATANMPSMRSMVPPNPAEPAMTSGVGAGRMSGVAMGTVYEGDSQSAGSSRTPQVSAGAGVPSGQNSAHEGHHPSFASTSGSENGPLTSNNRLDVSVGSGSAGYLPNAPYQEMLQSFGKEDPTIARARSQMASLKHSKQMDRPYPEAGLPQEPTSQAKEPSIPPSRLGRRILANKPKREPNFVIPKLQGGEISAELQMSNLECVDCHACLLVPKSAVVIWCPNCDQVSLVANCRVLRPST